MEAFAYNLDYIIQNEGISQSELAKRSNIGKSTISKYLNAKQMPTMKTISNICYALGCEFEDIIPVSYTHLDVYKRQSLIRV